MSPSSDHITPKAAVNFRVLSDLSQIKDEWIRQLKDLNIMPETYRAIMKRGVEAETSIVFGAYDSGLIGFLWVDLDPIENALYIHCYSLDKTYWHTKNHFNSLIKLLRWIKTILKVDKVRWYTTRPALYKKLGYAPSKRILMEA